MKLYLNEEKLHVDPRPLNDILWGLKALCVMCHSSLLIQYEQQESLKLFNRARPSPTHSGIWKETLVRPSALTSTTRALKLLLWLLPLNTQCKICVISLHFNAQNHDKKRASFQWTKSRWYYGSETWAQNRYMVRVFSILNLFCSLAS